MQLISRMVISNFGEAHFRNARSIVFHPEEQESIEALANIMSTGFVSLFMRHLFTLF